jgi:hypothetical protein
MSALHRAATRSCFFVPNFAEGIKPAPGQVLSLGASNLLTFGPGLGLSVPHAATTQLGPFTFSQFAQWTTPEQNQAIIFDSMGIGLEWVAANDANLDISIIDAQLGLGDGNTLLSLRSGRTLPFSMKLGSFGTGAYVFWFYPDSPIPPLLPRPLPSTTGPSLTFVLKNNEVASDGVFGVAFFANYRVLDGCDFSVGAAVPGAGMGPEWA